MAAVINLCRCEDESGEGPTLSDIFDEFMSAQPPSNANRNATWLEYGPTYIARHVMGHGMPFTARNVSSQRFG